MKPYKNSSFCNNSFLIYNPNTKCNVIKVFPSPKQNSKKVTCIVNGNVTWNEFVRDRYVIWTNVVSRTKFLQSSNLPSKNALASNKYATVCTHSSNVMIIYVIVTQQTQYLRLVKIRYKIVHDKIYTFFFKIKLNEQF